MEACCRDARTGEVPILCCEWMVDKSEGETPHLRQHAGRVPDNHPSMHTPGFLTLRCARPEFRQLASNPLPAWDSTHAIQSTTIKAAPEETAGTCSPTGESVMERGSIIDEPAGVESIMLDTISQG